MHFGIEINFYKHIISGDDGQKKGVQYLWLTWVIKSIDR